MSSIYIGKHMHIFLKEYTVLFKNIEEMETKSLKLWLNIKLRIHFIRSGYVYLSVLNYSTYTLGKVMILQHQPCE